MIYKVGLMGATGRMGQELALLLGAGYSLGPHIFELSDAVDRSGSLLSVEGISVRRLEDPPREAVHVWIDFSRPDATLALLEATDVPVVIGTTGFTDDQLQRIGYLAARRPVLLCPNTSPGMSALVRLVEGVGGLKSAGFTAVLSEDHHRNKVDAPSGTAKRLLECLAVEGYTDVPVHVTRAGSIVGTHTVRLIGDGEELVISHRVTDRRIFARGAIWGAQFLLSQKTPRVYGFDEITAVSQARNEV